MFVIGEGEEQEERNSVRVVFEGDKDEDEAVLEVDVGAEAVRGAEEDRIAGGEAEGAVGIIRQANKESPIGERTALPAVYGEAGKEAATTQVTSIAS